MKKQMLLSVGLVAVGLLSTAGCPQSTDPLEYITGGTGETSNVAPGVDPIINVISPTSSLSIAAGTPIEVNWSATARTRFAVLTVFFDRDQNPDNGNEVEAAVNIPLSESRRLVDTTDLAGGSYFVGVSLEEAGAVVATDYAPGQLIVNQRPDFFFSSPRSNFAFDRTQSVNPRFDVAWSVLDPDSTIRTRIYLDPDSTVNGNEILLWESDSQSGGSFSFDFPTSLFEPGTYRILALVSDGVSRTDYSFYSPGTIRLRARLAGFIDLRDIDQPNGIIQGAVFEGFNPRDNAGSFVSSMRDLDNDGFDELMIMAQFGKPQYQAGLFRTGIGEAYLLYGRSTRFLGSISLNSTGTLFRGEIFGGVPEVPVPIRPSRGLASFSLLSDWDNDGVREFAFGLPFTDSVSFGVFENSGVAPLDAPGYFRSGGVVVCSGSVLRPDRGFPGRNVINLAEIGTRQHKPISCPAPGAISTEPPPADFCPCLEGLVGPKASNTAQTSGATSFHEHLRDADGVPNSGSVRLGCRISTNEFGDQCGETIAAYDFDSLVISVPNRDPLVATRTNSTRGISIEGAGVVSVYYCFTTNAFFPWQTTSAPPAAGNYPGLGDPTFPELLPHGGPYHYIIDDFRSFTVGSGAVGNPISTIALGSPGYYVDPDDSEEPCSRTTHGLTPQPQTTVRFWGDTPGARIGSTRGAGDMTGDGLQELMIGSPLSNEGAGAVFIVFGRLRELVIGGEMALEELTLPMNAPPGLNARIFDGIRIVGSPGDRLGSSQDEVGDFNGDGLSDILMGSSELFGRRGGAGVFFGSRTVINLTEREIPFAELPQRGEGVLFVGETPDDLAGARVSTAGDVDGDGLTDILIAAPGRSVRLDIDADGTLEVDRTNCGVVYLVYGSRDLRGTLNLSDVGSELLPGAVFIGRNSADFLGGGLGEQGDRSTGVCRGGDVDGDGFGEVMLGSVTASPRNRVAAGEAYLIYGQGEASNGGQ